MKDLHNHLLFDTDDGSKSIEESLKTLKELENRGVSDVILTPHYILESEYCSKVLENQKKFDELKSELVKNNINIKLYLGNEVFISDNIVSLISSGEIATLNNSRYILMELPMNNKVNNLDGILFKLLSNNYIPIIAHVERYRIFDDKISTLINYVNSGILLQCNLGSIYGKYGPYSKKAMKKYLKYNLISFIGTDIHNYHSALKVNDGIKELNKYISKDVSKKILEDNFDSVINNQKIKVDVKEKLKFIDRVREWI